MAAWCGGSGQEKNHRRHRHGYGKRRHRVDDGGDGVRDVDGPWPRALLWRHGAAQAAKKKITDDIDTATVKGDTAWMMVATAFVMLMVPGLALFYGGMVRRKRPRKKSPTTSTRLR